GETVIAKLPGIVRDLRGTKISLGAIPEKVHLFADGQSLLYR
ncbi:MAG: ABC transporter ATP-binding protein, partial [Rhodobacteraceae bacterium]|nr:ABC transporter ATP-binding protein [Paracoccaceae bacterium]